MRRRMQRLLYWCFTIFGLTGVFIVLMGRPRLLSSPSHHTVHSNGRGGHFLSPDDLQDVQEVTRKPAQFLAPVENPGISGGRDPKIVIGKQSSVDKHDSGQPLQLQRNLHSTNPELAKTNMRKLDEVRNISKSGLGPRPGEEVPRSATPKPTPSLRMMTGLNESIEETSRQYSAESDEIVSVRSPNETRHNDTGKKSRTLKLEDIFIGVKTTVHYHKSRMAILYQTWFQQVKNQTYFFTDGNDPEWQEKTGGHMINTECPTDHRRQSLCCKFAVMYLEYMESGKKWFCHLDDDTYLNVPNLLSLLSGYAHDKDYYIGRSSLNHAIETVDREDNMKNIQFWFATGGAGFCVSRALALNMFPYAGGGFFKTMCNRIRLPDDVTVGFISEYLVGTKLINTRLFNSHLQSLAMLTGEQLKKQVTLSYGLSDQRTNVVGVPGATFSAKEDPSRLLSFHCYLFPKAELCRRGDR